MKTKTKERLILERKYKKGDYILSQEFTQRSMKHIPEQFTIQRIDMLADGLVELDGVEYVFHTLRVIMK